MKKFQIKVLTYTGSYETQVYAENFSTNNSGFYKFICDGDIVSCYPIDKTIILSIENIEEN
jgi:hypothetical protein